MSTIGVIIIGRNEGERLVTCLNSVHASLSPGASVVDIVYVDSNSTDNSCTFAAAYRAHVIQLDPTVPFTAARARNAGAQALLERHSDVKYLQFLDADTELDPAWMSHAAGFLDSNRRVAAIAGRLRERYPEASIYNFLADMEWNTPLGPAQEFAGDAMLRAEVFQKLHGYSPNFIAGEEPEFAARIRLAGYQIVRLDHEMALHDLAMHKFSQWLRRTYRSGHAIAQLHYVHGAPPLRLYHKPWRSTFLWTLAIPLAIIVLAWLKTPWLLLLLPLAYGYLISRITSYRLRRGDPFFASVLYALFTAFGKFPQLLGMFAFYRNRWRKRPSTLIEYKSASVAPAANPPPAAVGNT
jgi:GT2 family glycosyltransferase